MILVILDYSLEYPIIVIYWAFGFVLFDPLYMAHPIINADDPHYISQLLWEDASERIRYTR